MAQDDKALLARLQNHGVEFVLIGGVCGVMHGAGLITVDLDVCCRFGVANLRRIEAALKDLNPWHRLTPNKLPFVFTDTLCSSLKNLYLQTDLGKLDCLGDVLGVGSYEDALKHSEQFEMSFGSIRMLDLDTLIAAKEAAGRDKDKYAVPLLRAVAEKKRKKRDTDS
jgi:hypothetical protein